MSVLSQVESEGEVGANPTAAAASASGINPVSRDGCFFSSLTIMYRVYAGREKSLKKTFNSVSSKTGLKGIKKS